MAKVKEKQYQLFQRTLGAKKCRGCGRFFVPAGAQKCKDCSSQLELEIPQINYWRGDS